MKYPLCLCAEHSAICFEDCIYCPNFFRTNQLLCFSINLIYELQAIYVLNIMTVDKNSPLPTFHSMKSHRNHGDNTVCIT